MYQFLPYTFNYNSLQLFWTIEVTKHQYDLTILVTISACQTIICPQALDMTMYHLGRLTMENTPTIYGEGSQNLYCSHGQFQGYL